jgi:hypothetical protein
MQLELTEQERSALVDLVKAAHSDIGAEIHHAEVSYRETLRRQRALLEDLLKRLGAEVKQAA